MTVTEAAKELAKLYGELLPTPRRVRQLEDILRQLVQSCEGKAKEPTKDVVEEARLRRADIEARTIR